MEKTKKSKTLFQYIMITILVMIIAAAITLIIIFTGGDEDVESVEIISIEVDPDTMTSTFKVGESFPEDAKIVVIYADKSSEDIALTIDMVSGFDTTKPGDIDLTITYKGKEASYSIEVLNWVKSIEVSETSKSKVCYIGDTFPDDLKILVKYADSTVIPVSITESMVGSFDSSTSGIFELTVTYQGVIDKFNLTIMAHATSISIDTNTIYDEYYLGDYFPQNVKLNIVREDGTTDDINLDAEMVTGFDTTSTGIKNLKISYDGLEIEHQINIYKEIKEIVIEKNEIDVDYKVGDIFNLESVKLKIIHHDESETLIPLKKMMVIDFDSSISGNLHFNIKYRNLSIKIDYKVSGVFKFNSFKIEFDFAKNVYNILEYIGGSASSIIFPDQINGERIGHIAPGILGRNFLTIKNLVIPFIGSDSTDNVNKFEYLFDSEYIEQIKQDKSFLVEFSALSFMNVTIIPGYISEIPESAFEDVFIINTLILPEGIIKIGDRAFCNAYIENIILPSTLTTISGQAFEEMSVLNHLVLPDALQVIAEKAFYNTPVYLTLPEIPIMSIVSNSFQGVSGLIIPSSSFDLYNSSSNWKVLAGLFYDAQYINITQDGYIIFDNDDQLILLTYKGSEKDLVLPDGITQISDNAFKLNTKLKTVKLSESLEKIGNYAFYKSTLESISIPQSLIEIGDYAFFTYALSRIKIPNSVTKLGANIIDNGILIMESEIPLKNIIMDSLKIVLVPDNAISAYKTQWTEFSDIIYALSNLQYDYLIFNSVLKYYLGTSDTIIVPNGVVKIDKYAFSYNAQLPLSKNKKIISVTIPSTVEIIEESAFAFNVYLKSVVFTGVSKLTTIKDKAFYSCLSLYEFVWSDSIESIGKHAFAYTQIEELVLSESSALITINNNAFMSCELLSLVILPKSIKTLGADIFFESYNIDKIHMIAENSNNIALNSDWNRIDEDSYCEVVWGYVED
ncbi:MAG: leucine-rich repeat protein [Christensenellaceae bacterium]|nr:leucine-rich repeat protein [Christensenellaceae bacterium]